MKNVLKTAFFAALLLVVACGEAVAEKETAVVAATPATKPMVKETPKPETSETVATPAPTEKKEMEKAVETKTAPVKTPVEEVTKKAPKPVEQKVENYTTAAS